MMHLKDFYNLHAEALSAQALAQDRNDYFFAISDVDVGRYRKHIQDKDIDPITGRKRDKVAEAMQRTLEWLLLNDPLYRQAHDDLMTAIREAQSVTETALQKVLGELEIERTAYEEMLASAARLPTGERVFRDADGNIRTFDGEVISDERAETIQWRGDEPSYEDIKAKEARIKQLEQAESELRGIETELGDIHNGANQNDAPLSVDDLHGEKDRVDDLEKRATEIELGLNTTASNIDNDVSTEVSKIESVAGEVVPNVNFYKSSL